jgi:hypothetical protein
VTIAVTHEMLSRTLQGAYGGCTPTETLGRSHRQDRMYRLHDGQIAELRCCMWSTPRLLSVGGLWTSTQAEPQASVLSTSTVAETGRVGGQPERGLVSKPGLPRNETCYAVTEMREVQL